MNFTNRSQENKKNKSSSENKRNLVVRCSSELRLFVQVLSEIDKTNTTQQAAPADRQSAALLGGS